MAGEPRPLTRADIDRAALTAARAFAWHEPWGAWALPDEETQAIYTEVVSRLFRLGGEPAEAGAGDPEPFPTDRSRK